MTKEVINKSPQGAKKRLKDVTFDHETAHLALCSKEQGAANNQESAVLLKSKNFSPELIAKAQRVQVTMDLPEFLRKFFDMWYDDAEVLARMFGYVPDETEYEPYDWIEERLSAFEILKSVHEAKDMSVALASLSENQYSMILDDQELFLKSMKEFESNSGVDNSAETKVEKVEPVGSKQKQVKKEKKVAQETIEKAAYDTLQAQMDAQKEELQKARDALEAIQKEKAEILLKSRIDAVTAVVSDEAQVALIMKAAGAADAEAFAGLVQVLKAQHELLEKSGMFSEKGVTVETEDAVKPVSNLAALIKKKYPDQA